VTGCRSDSKVHFALPSQYARAGIAVYLERDLGEHVVSEGVELDEATAARVKVKLLKYSEFLIAKRRQIERNILNAETVGSWDAPRVNDPYQRSSVEWDDHSMSFVTVKDLSEFRKRYDPGHPLASNGFVLLPNVDSTVEKIDLLVVDQDQKATQAAIDCLK